MQKTTKSWVRLGWWLPLTIALSPALGGCPEDAGSGSPSPVGPGGSLTAPSVSIPAYTNKTPLALSGGKSAQTGVWKTFEGQESEVSVVDATTFWFGELNLTEGENVVSFFAVDASGNRSASTQDFTVTLDTTPPEQPVIDTLPEECIFTDKVTLEGTVEPGTTLLANEVEVAVDDSGNFSATVDSTQDAVFLVEDRAGNQSEPLTIPLSVGLPTPELNEITSPTEENTQTLTGTKVAGMAVVLRFEGEEEGTEIVPAGPETIWSYELTLAERNTVFYIDGESSEGETCGESGPFEIIYSNVCAPVVDREGLPTVTSNSEVTITGTRCANVSTWYRLERQALSEGTEIAELSEETTFSFEYNLSEGLNKIYVFNQDFEGLPSPQDGPIEITLDTQPPAPPTILTPSNNAETTELQATITGTKEPLTSILIRRGQDVEYTEVLSLNDSGEFSLSAIDLEEGRNDICLATQDAAGNRSIDREGPASNQETCINIVRLDTLGASILILAPQRGTIINAEPFTALARVEDEAGVQEVSFCFDNVCNDAIDAGADEYTYTITPGEHENGSSHTLEVRAINNEGLPSSRSLELLYIESGYLLSTTSPTETSENPQMAVDGSGRLHVVWSDQCNRSENCELFQEGNLPYDIFHRALDGSTWSPIRLLSDSPGDGDSRNPQISSDAAGNLHLVWQDNGLLLDAGDDRDVFYRSFDAETNTWGAVELVSEGSDEPDQVPSVVGDSDGSPHVVWERRGVNDDFDIYYTTRQGGIWQTPTLISNDPGNADSRNADIAIDMLGRVYIVWQDDGDVLESGEDFDIYFKTIVNGEFSSSILVSDNFLDGVSLLPQVVTDSQNVAHIVWQDNGNFQASGMDFDIFYRTYNFEDGLDAYRLVTHDPLGDFSEDVSITVDPASDILYIVWIDSGYSDTGNDIDIFYKRGLAGAFGRAEVVSQGDGFSLDGSSPSILFDPITGNLHFVWQDLSPVGQSREDQDIYYFGLRID